MFDLRSRIQQKLTDAALTTCTRWSEARVHMPNPFPGPINFDRFPWQREILNINEGLVTVQKAAQIGYSIAGMVRALYVVSERKNDVLYVLPTQGLAGDFSKARLDALIQLSPHLHGLFDGGDSVGLKTTLDRTNLYIRGSVSSRGLVSVPVSSAIIDEYDRCADGTYDLVTERLSGQLTKYLFALSTPTLPELGINAKFKEGTMERFMFPCPSCGKHIHLKFPENVLICGEYLGDPETARSRYICDKCNAVLPHETKIDWLAPAKWVPERTNVQGHRSFHVNQLYSMTVTPEEMVSAHFKSQTSEIAATEFANQKLGVSYVADGARLSESIIRECFDGDYRLGSDTPEDASRMICMGIDVGTFLDVWIAEFTFDRSPGGMPYENSRSRLLQSLRIPTNDSTCWEQVGNLMREYQVRYAVTDMQPDTVSARRFCRAFRGYSALCQYRRGTTGNEIKEVMDEQRVPTLTVDRTVFLDLALGRFHKKRITVPSTIPHIIIDHLKAPMRGYELDEMGLPRGVYRSAGDDHQAHAAAYCEIAFHRSYCQSTGRTIKPGEAL